jgi:cob(I)alamin adenosyltransferase
MPRKLRKGFVQVYTGGGKGKTTAAAGLTLRALGHGLRVYMVQFLKKGFKYGELSALKRFPNFKFAQFGRGVYLKRPTARDAELAQKALDHAREIVRGGKYDIVVLDEVNVALGLKLIKVADVVDLIESKPPGVELILTGRNAPAEIIQRADLVTEMVEVKHPFSKGVKARAGIEY